MCTNLKSNGVYSMLKTKSLNDGTIGKRFCLFGVVKGLYRRRGGKTRYDITSGSTMTGFHFGKRSLYIEKANGRNLYNFAG